MSTRYDSSRPDLIDKFTLCLLGSVIQNQSVFLWLDNTTVENALLRRALKYEKPGQLCTFDPYQGEPCRVSNPSELGKSGAKNKKKPQST